MNPVELGVGALRPSIFLTALVAATYATPLLHVVLMPLRLRSLPAVKACKMSGSVEIFLAPIRDTVGLLVLALTASWQIVDMAASKSLPPLFVAVTCAALIASSLYHRFVKTKSLVSLCEFMAKNPTIHPQEFFDYLFCCGGFLSIKLPKSARRLIDPENIDFKKGSEPSKIGMVQKLKGVWTTMMISSLTSLVKKKLGCAVLLNMSGAFASVWASRMAQLINAEVKVEGLNEAGLAPARRIYAFTHKSFFDFIFAPLVPISVSLRENSGALKPVPSFLLAANHFKRNFIFSRVFGIGRAAQNLGMIFVERNGRQSCARDAAILGARKLAEEGLDVALFPQGTRARPYCGLKGIPSDAGYYTVGSSARVGEDGKHLKRGISYIACETALMLGEKSPWRIEIVPVAIQGTANICPRKSSVIHRDVSVRLCVGEPIEIEAQNCAPLFDSSMPSESSKYAFAEILVRRIDAALTAASKVHAELERRFFRDVRGLCDAHEFDEIAIAMKSWRGDDTLVHAVLDVIYSCPQKEQRKLAGELIFLLQNFAERDEIVAFKKKAAALLV